MVHKTERECINKTKMSQEIMEPIVGFNVIIGLDRDERDKVLSKVITDHPTRTLILSNRTFQDSVPCKPFSSQILSQILKRQRHLVENHGLGPKTELCVVLDNPKALSMLYTSNMQLQTLILQGKNINIQTVLSTPILPVFHRLLDRVYILPSVSPRLYKELGDGLYDKLGDYLRDAYSNVLILTYPDEGPGEIFKLSTSHL